MGITIRDVARRANVSISTVSRVLNDTCPVDEEKRRRVEEAAKALGYRPNPAARILLKQETGGLGVLLPFVSGEFFTELLNGIDQAAQQSGYFLLMSSSHRHEAELEAALRGMYKRVDGLIIMAPEMQAETLRRYLNAKQHVVFLNTQVAGTDFDAFNFDNFEGGYLVTRHLLEQGHRRIATIAGPTEAQDARDRLLGYRKALQEFSVAPDPALEIPGDFSTEAGFDAVPVILNLKPRPTAIVAGNDQSAMGVLSALRQAGVRIPDDLSVTGFDDIPSARFIQPPLTTIKIPIKQMGVQAIQLLLDRITGKVTGPPRQKRMAVELIVRDSTGPVVEDVR